MWPPSFAESNCNNGDLAEMRAYYNLKSKNKGKVPNFASPEAGMSDQEMIMATVDFYKRQGVEL